MTNATARASSVIAGEESPAIVMDEDDRAKGEAISRLRELLTRLRSMRDTPRPGCGKGTHYDIGVTEGINKSIQQIHLVLDCTR